MFARWWRRDRSRNISPNLEDYADAGVLSLPALSTENDQLGPMGMTGNLPPSPTWPGLNMAGQGLSMGTSAAAAQWLNQSQSNMAAQQASSAASVHPLATKAHQQMARASEALPMRVAARISRIEFHSEPRSRPMVFIVIFDNGRTLEFDDVDKFPADEHIARIVLECP